MNAIIYNGFAAMKHSLKCAATSLHIIINAASCVENEAFIAT